MGRRMQTVHWTVDLESSDSILRPVDGLETTWINISNISGDWDYNKWLCIHWLIFSFVCLFVCYFWDVHCRTPKGDSGSAGRNSPAGSRWLSRSLPEQQAADPWALKMLGFCCLRIMGKLFSFGVVKMDGPVSLESAVFLLSYWAFRQMIGISACITIPWITSQ